MNFATDAVMATGRHSLAEARIGSTAYVAPGCQGTHTGGTLVSGKLRYLRAAVAGGSLLHRDTPLEILREQVTDVIKSTYHLPAW